MLKRDDAFSQTKRECEQRATDSSRTGIVHMSLLLHSYHTHPHFALAQLLSAGIITRRSGAVPGCIALAGPCVFVQYGILSTPFVTMLLPPPTQHSHAGGLHMSGTRLRLGNSGT